MKTEEQIRSRLDKAYEMLAYYWSHLPEHFPEEYLSPELRVPVQTQAEMIIDRVAVERNYNLRSPKNLVEAAKGFNEAFTTCVMLEWMLELDSPLARKGD
ncbi:hypothetical protein ACFLXV_03410 [Chloroflexota bacterium]|jgi:hypothetical protein